MNVNEVFSTNNILQSINNNDPIYQITEKEFNVCLLKFGSFMSILKNKRINQTMLLTELLESEAHRDCFKRLSGIDTTNILLYNIIIRFPVLYKSKIIKNKIEELYCDRTGKALL